MRLLVAGATGQLGAGLVEAAERRGITLVPLVRPIAGRGAGWRLKRLAPDRPELAAAALDGDVTASRWGLGDRGIDALAPEVDAVLNVAAETNWAAPRRRLHAVNVLGAVHGIQVANALRARHPRCGAYIYAGSIFAAGGQRGSIPEEVLGPEAERTPYEQSKWLAEHALLTAQRADGLALGLARVGGLVGSSRTGATAKRNSLYLLAEGWQRMPGHLLPVAHRGRVDMLPRDIAADALLRVTSAVLRGASAQPQIAHVCAGETATTTSALIAALAASDRTGRVAPPRPFPVPARALVWTSMNLDRLTPLSPTVKNAVQGLRYLALDRTFERTRLARLIGDLPAVSAEEIARLAFGLAAAPSPPVRSLDASLATFAG